MIDTSLRLGIVEPKTTSAETDCNPSEQFVVMENAQYITNIDEQGNVISGVVFLQKAFL